MGEQLAVGLYVGLWESPWASLSQPLKSRDYLGQQDTLLRTSPPQQGWGQGRLTEVLSAKPQPHKSLRQKRSPEWRDPQTLTPWAQLPRLRTIPHARQGFRGAPS